MYVYNFCVLALKFRLCLNGSLSVLLAGLIVANLRLHCQLAVQAKHIIVGSQLPSLFFITSLYAFCVSVVKTTTALAANSLKCSLMWTIAPAASTPACPYQPDASFAVERPAGIIHTIITTLVLLDRVSLSWVDSHICIRICVCV